MLLFPGSLPRQIRHQMESMPEIDGISKKAYSTSDGQLAVKSSKSFGKVITRILLR